MVFSGTSVPKPTSIGQKFISTMREQWNRSMGILLWCYIPLILIGAILLVIKVRTEFSVSTLTRDPSAVAGMPMYIGSISNLGILLWCITATVTLFSALILLSNDDTSIRSQFLLSAGLLTSVLLLDDLYLIHESVLPEFHIPEILTYSLYIGTILVFLARFRAFILRTNYLILLIALGSFAFSIASDKIVPGGYIVEDFAKLLGIVSWSAYFMSYSVSTVLPPGSNAKGLVRRMINLNQ